MDIPSSSARKIHLAIGDEKILFFSKEETKVYSV